MGRWCELGLSGIFEVPIRHVDITNVRVPILVDCNGGCATHTADRVLGTDELPLIVASHRAEMDRLARDDAMLRSIADRSGGRFDDISALPDVIDRIIARQENRATAPAAGRSFRVYNFTLLFVALAGILTAEWLLRRRWQLH